ncbi:restriction endonuclease subunit S [Vibrio parahaemolyticus]|uniref:restriction endonuclease subunit S n=1 Tax=Vibrio parahaemolyticus TaxID=670 RepID=UPI00387AAC3C
MGSKVKLGELLDVLTDYHANGAYQKLKENVELLDTPDYAVMIRTTNFEQTDFTSNLKYVTEYAYNFLAKSKVYPNDIVMNKIANAGSSYLMPDLGKPVSLAMNLFLLRVNEKKANPVYVYLYLKINEAYVKSFANGSVTKTITKDAVRNLDIVLPERNLQDLIVSQFNSINNKISLNRQINQTLEQMAQTLFKSWFVDFDPVIDNALDAGSDIPEVFESRVERRKAVRESADFKPLPDDVRRLFPSEFEESEIGWVPKGWIEGNISDLALINPSSWTKKNAPDQVEYVDLASAKFGTIQSSDIYAYDEAPSRARRILSKHDTIFGMVRPANRSFAYVDRNGLTGSTGFVVVRAKESAARSFIHIAITSNDAISEFVRIADGAAYPAIKPDDIADYPTVLPCPEVLKLFEGIVSNYQEKIATNISSTKSLTKLRDTLLPKLISGELRLDSPEVEQAKALVD